MIVLANIIKWGRDELSFLSLWPLETNDWSRNLVEKNLVSLSFSRFGLTVAESVTCKRISAKIECSQNKVLWCDTQPQIRTYETYSPEWPHVVLPWRVRLVFLRLYNGDLEDHARASTDGKFPFIRFRRETLFLFFLFLHKIREQERKYISGNLTG